MNPIIKILILADFFIFSGLGLINPIFAVFIKDSLVGGSLSTVGIATAVYLIVKAVLQIPISQFTDREQASVREFWTLIFGYLIIAATPFLYLMIHTVLGLYAVQAFYGLGAALAFPGFMAIFTKFADHKRAGFSWSFYSTVTLLSAAAAASIGGFVGEQYGFRMLLLGVGTLTFLGFFTTLGLALFYDDLRLVNPQGIKPFWHRLMHFLGRHKHPPTLPPAGGIMPK
ncbi:hypothetical protein A3B21_02500 [Candidatus Uhrbacteria bacterium RIFCSPLOWO2_01_FULL_47_24]|uniref:Major facilitator superfamily (MFS) profile domain-containing protein n=1 Tax=Candidatus Uhrbacteria bacterium RIFCSPLOWO2_01_FULL_47_24 TaxID=1802401 RepID=A0A1F7UNZ4_9BACT|nr:MAG: hypothetical protein A2753_02340 [Candidatus Uhrbacteria bacterium RIFCSPHIGHO2_01_FULL_47_11]OGL68275.1 MAG: hypothetical protein A3D58_04720 [Candidatus Uhrbacteria bacterium RIFCSPHIGHO2_02_FULL_46_47]OGL76994.1 MAG: hypothetical protein A3F52_02495 [Candidatus Uhrbacteria bacterium RIFCSPHIGHO2_12_FULL_47_11]OGL80013.1 MAG: hypothetical protein A3B21_02500 [Candidatus Uhrbacteria bacterium RIFCSPLOWO2_01_FULL_47_24]OGL85211.1 MAG: hypothetical protein A3J03_00090 [Candidatus Uhrbact